MGYLNRFIDLSFPDLAGVDSNGHAVCWVKIRNPRMIPGADLIGAASKIRVDPETGVPVDSGAAASETFDAFAKIILAGQVWDAKWTPQPDENGNTDWDAEPPLIPMPPSPEHVGRMPVEILNAIGEEMKKANPQPSPAPSSTTTSP
jgi:hypothetical protein